MLFAEWNSQIDDWTTDHRRLKRRKFKSRTGAPISNCKTFQNFVGYWDRPVVPQNQLICRSRPSQNGFIDPADAFKGLDGVERIQPFTCFSGIAILVQCFPPLVEMLLRIFLPSN